VGGNREWQEVKDLHGSGRGLFQGIALEIELKKKHFVLNRK
jgi:hypothetical protein